MSEATTVKEVLIAAKWILENKGWCQGFYYKDKDGNDVKSCPKQEALARACSFCSVGAIISVEASETLLFQAEDLLAKTVGDGDIVGFNDDKHTTRQQVLIMFDRAIERAT